MPTKGMMCIVSVGTTGGVDVPPLRLMEIPADIREIMKQYMGK